MTFIGPPIFILFGVFQCLSAQRSCPTRPSSVSLSQKLVKLRTEMAKPLSGRGFTLEAFIITSDDEHQNEFVADRDKRLEYITGYRGRIGQAAVTRTKAAVWVAAEDYWQAGDELECDWIIYKLDDDQVLAFKGPHLTEWLRKELRTGVRVGADSKLVPASKWEDWKKDLEVNHIALLETASNLVDDIWIEGRPSYSSGPAYFIDGGESREAKLDMLRSNLSRLECGAMIVTALDEIAWLLNVRGREGTYTPFVRSYLIVTRAEAFWYISRDQRTDVIYRELEKQNISRIRTQLYDNIWKDLRTNAHNWGRVLVPARCEFAAGASQYIATAVPTNKRVMKQSPVIFLKTHKNAKEVNGMQAANLRSSAAFVDFMAFLEEEIQNNGNWTELSLTNKIIEYQQNQTGYQIPAAPVLVAFGAHGAQRNFVPDTITESYIDDSSTLVLQSAHHFIDGTSAVSRTMHFGIPSFTEIKLYSLTLASLIELSRQIFPPDIRTAELDLLARSPLWKEGLTYNYSTGHGIGAFSSLHEPPVNLNRDVKTQMQVLHKGYFLTVNPSLINPGKFGIQLENVLEVVASKAITSNNYLSFREATLVPFETKLIEPSLLTAKQIYHINQYHARVLQEVGAELKRQSRMRGFYWLMQKTKHIAPYCNSSKNIVSGSLLALTIVRYMF